MWTHDTFLLEVNFMGGGINMRFSGVLQQFVKAQAGKNGMY
jgi:hypothetical protein